MQISQISHPCRSIFMGMEIKMRYLMQLLNLESVHNLVGASIDAFPSDWLCTDVVIVL